MIRRFIKWLVDDFRANQREWDKRILWPICKQKASTIDHAKAAFMMHASLDPAWRRLGEDEIIRQIEALK